MKTSIKSKKARVGEGIMHIKTLRAGWRRDAIQIKHPMWNYS